MKTGHITNSSSFSHQVWTIIPYRGKFVQFFDLIEGYQVFSHKLVDLKSGMELAFDFDSGWQELLNDFDQKAKADATISVLHLNYEFSSLVKSTPADELGVFLRFKEYQVLEELPHSNEKLISNYLIEATREPQFEEYEAKFQQVMENLNKGNCYQINLTEQFRFRFSGDQELNPFELAARLWSKGAGAYAHATYIGPQTRLILSNSPECLFQLEGQEVISMPIKGTLPLADNENLEGKWDELTSCPKNQSELDMITDLIRNDLSSLEFPRSQVVKRKAPLVVNKILHQYSKIKVMLDKQLAMAKFVKGLFPGGSITGAPKKRVCELIREIEKEPRGLYCGSTIIKFSAAKNSYHCASINIRTADINLLDRSFTYGAGGGITLQSQAKEEFEEMLLKVQSFTDLLQGSLQDSMSVIE